MRGIFYLIVFFYVKYEGDQAVYRKFLAVLLLLALPWTALAAHTRDEVRAAYRDASSWEEASPYARRPNVAAPYDEGALEPGAVQDALDYLNFIRWLAGLEQVHVSEIYGYQCQHAAVLLAAQDYVDHDAPQPEDMDRNFYDSAHLGTASGNIAKFNWMRNSVIREGVAYFVRDDGEQNLPVLGHRRWALNPLMAATGFGLANAQSGMSYVVMFAHDLGNPDATWDAVPWPAEGAFPAELMHDHLAWSVVLNPRKYDLEGSALAVTLEETTTGMTFAFNPAEAAGDGFCAVNLDGYGAGGCVIFRPDFTGLDFTDYQQNQRWRVTIDGLKLRNGGQTRLQYRVDMISLRAEDVVNVEISALEARMRPGETLRLTADVIPAYADDLSVTWRSTDEAVAAVDENGLVTARSEGACEIICADCAGHEDACAVSVMP